MKLKDLHNPFPADEIEWRIGHSGKRGDRMWATCLAYVQARAIMNRLDDVCRPENWKASYTFIPASQGVEPGVICHLAIKCGDEWVSKDDGAEQTDIESFKGGISSALKRAAVLWGIGRYLYQLESGFANIVEKGTQGAKYAKSKEGDFYWVHPKLPEWALPSALNKPVSDAPIAAAPTVATWAGTTVITSSTPASGLPPCEACGVPVRLSKAGNWYFCPDFELASKGEHSRFTIGKLDEYRKYMSAKKSADPNFEDAVL